MEFLNTKIKHFSLIILLFFPSKIFPQQINVFNQIRLAQTYRSVGQLEKAKNILLDTYKTNKRNLALYDELNKILIQLKDYETSEKIIKERIKIEPMNTTLYGDLGTTYFLKGEEKKAIETWEKGLNTNPDNAFTYRTIANYMIENRAIENAIDILKRGNKIAKNHTIFAYDLAHLYAMTMKFDKATEEYCKILQANPKQIGIIKSRILSYIHLNGAEKPTLKVVEDFYENNNQLIFLDLLAELYLKTDHIEKAFESYYALEKATTKNGSKLYKFAQIAYRLGYYKLAAKAFNTIITNYQSSALVSGAKIGYAKTLEADLLKQNNNESESWKPLKINNKINSKKNYSEIISAYLELTKEYPHNKIGIEAKYRLGKIYLDNLHNIKEAKKIFLNIINDNYEKTFVNLSKYELSRIAIINRNLHQAENYLTKLTDNSQVDNNLRTKAGFLLARIQTWQGKFKNAIQLLNELVENPKDKITNDALELLQILNIFKNDSTNLKKYFYADNLLMQNNFKDAATIFKEIAENKNLFILKDYAALNYIKLLFALNKYKETAIFLTKILDCDEANIYEDKFLFLLGIDFYYGLKQPSKAKKILTKLLEKYPTSLYHNKARKIISKIKIVENKKL